MFTCKYKYIRSVSQIMFAGLCCLLFSNVSAQSCTVTTNNTSFSVATSTQVETTATLASSFSLDIKSGPRSYSVDAYISSKSFNPSTTVFNTIPLNVKLRSVSGVSSAGGVAGIIPLVENPPGTSTLISNASKTNNNTGTWTYDLILDPIGYTIPPGTYNFTLTIQYQDGNNTITRSFNISLTVQSVVALALTQNGSTTIAFGTSSAYVNGVASASFCSFNIKSNVPWLLTLASQSPFFTPASSGADNTLPCGIVNFKPTGSSRYTVLTTSPQTVLSGNRGDNNTSGNTFSVDMQFNPGYNYNPGLYNLSLLYTLTGQ